MALHSCNEDDGKSFRLYSQYSKVNLESINNIIKLLTFQPISRKQENSLNVTEANIAYDKPGMDIASNIFCPLLPIARAKE